MPSQSPLRNGHHASSGTTPTRIPSPPHPAFRSPASDRKLRRISFLILLLRFSAFCFSLAAAVFMLSNSSRSGPASPSWDRFRTFRFVAAANGIVAVYSLFEVGAAVWEALKTTTPLPEGFQLWFDFSHDQVFAYMLLSAEAAGIGEARGLHKGDTCAVDRAFCVQADISVALGSVAFAFLALSALISGFRVVCHVITGYRFNI